MHLDVAQREGLAGEAIALFQFGGREFGLLFERGLGNSPGDDLDFAAVTVADAATNTDNIYVKLASAFEQGLVARTRATAADGFKINVEQWNFSSPTVSNKYSLQSTA
jgi:hypothetical protein